MVGPAAAWFGWERADYDALAGAVVAGHVIECGTQATGGNYAFFTELLRDGRELGHPGFPIAEIYPDGSSVITKHESTQGAVTVGTVTAQLLYEIGDARYAGPDVTARFDTARLTQLEVDRVRISGVRGEPPPPELKVCLNTLRGFRNEVDFVLTGLDIEAKAELVRGQLDAAFGHRRAAEVRWSMVRNDHADADTEEQASTVLRCVVHDAEQEVVGRAFSGAAVKCALASYPGFHLTVPPDEAEPYGVYISAFVPAKSVDHISVLLDGASTEIPPPAVESRFARSRCATRQEQRCHRWLQRDHVRAGGEDVTEMGYPR